jgi:antagonist of KipI
MATGEPMTIRVIKPGWCTTVQDLGRYGYQHYGVSVSGAMDRLALVIGNRLVKNHDTAAALEITLVGPELLFERPAVIAVTGADLSPAIDGHAVPLWTTAAIEAGSRLTFGRRRTGARSYLAVEGGFDIPLLWGSRSTHVATGIGGFNGRALAVADALRVAFPSTRNERPSIGTSLADDVRPRYVDAPMLRVIAGPQHIGQDALSVLTSTAYRLTSKSDRMGYRLDGPCIPQGAAYPQVSGGSATGALQIPPDGSPILLMADRPTAGGYPKIAVVIAADLPQAAQLQPGDRVTFRTITLPEAESALANQRRRINEVLPCLEVDP